MQKETGKSVAFRTKNLPLVPSRKKSTENHWKERQTNLRIAGEIEKEVCRHQTPRAFNGKMKRLVSARVEGTFQRNPTLRQNPWDTIQIISDRPNRRKQRGKLDKSEG